MHTHVRWGGNIGKDEHTDNRGTAPLPARLRPLWDHGRVRPLLSSQTRKVQLWTDDEHPWIPARCKWNHSMMSLANLWHVYLLLHVHVHIHNPYDYLHDIVAILHVFQLIYDQNLLCTVHWMQGDYGGKMITTDQNNERIFCVNFKMHIDWINHASS